ncbi:MAG: hypothetical protein JW715_03800 [Sedimentisphaerales bacterium]|nr:hypothetical protein [Sedimentisphaerales bacterium]
MKHETKWATKFVSLIIIGIIMLSGFTTKVLAEDEIGFEFTSDYYGKYIWRGQNLVDDPVFQPGFSASYKGFTAGIWGSLETTNINGNSGDFSEVDYSIDYSGTVPGAENVGFSIGAIYYDFPGTAVPGTTELYWGLSLDAPLSPSVTFYHDIDEADGLYASLGVGYSVEKILELGPDIPVAMELGASYGWGSSSYNKYYWGLSDSKANDLTLSASFPFEIGGWNVSASLNYVTLVSDDISDTNTYGTDDDFFFVGIGLSKGF